MRDNAVKNLKKENQQLKSQVDSILEELSGLKASISKQGKKATS